MGCDSKSKSKLSNQKSKAIHTVLVAFISFCLQRSLLELAEQNAYLLCYHRELHMSIVQADGRGRRILFIIVETPNRLISKQFYLLIFVSFYYFILSHLNHGSCTWYTSQYEYHDELRFYDLASKCCEYNTTENSI